MTQYAALVGETITPDFVFDPGEFEAARNTKPGHGAYINGELVGSYDHHLHAVSDELAQAERQKKETTTMAVLGGLAFGVSTIEAVPFRSGVGIFGLVTVGTSLLERYWKAPRQITMLTPKVHEAEAYLRASRADFTPL